MLSRTVFALILSTADATLHRGSFVPLGRSRAAPQPLPSSSISAGSELPPQRVSAAPRVAWAEDDDDEEVTMYEADEADEGDILAEWAPLSDAGFQEVANTQSSDQMKTFVKRILDTESRHVQNEAGLSGLVPFYVGSDTGKTLEMLKTDLRNSKHMWWIGEGKARTAPLNEDGYNEVAALKSNKEMRAFMRRAVAASGFQLVSEGSINGVVPYYSGVAGTQSYAAMLAEIKKADWVVAKADGAVGQTAPLNQEGYEMVKQSCSPENLAMYVNRVLDAEARFIKDKVRFQKFAEKTGCKHKDLEALKKDIRKFPNKLMVGDGPGRTASVDTNGFKKVAASKSNHQMKAFIRRVIQSMGKSIQNEGSFSGIIQFYSGVHLEPGSFDDLKGALRSAEWLQ